MYQRTWSFYSDLARNATHSMLFLEFRIFFGLKIRQIEVETTAIKVISVHSEL